MISLSRMSAFAVAGGALMTAQAASAASTSVTSGSLSWAQANVYVSSPTVQKTWLGYVTGPGPSLANGTVSPIAPGTGPTVDGTSPRGADQISTYVLPSTAGTIDPETGVGALQLDGGVTFAGTGHFFTGTIEDPTVTLNGLTGTLAASGGGFSATPLDPSATIFDLNLTNSTVVVRTDGSREITNIVPSIAESNYPFNGYPAGAGPDRTPNTFGSFSLRFRLPTEAAQAGPVGPVGPQGPAGVDGAQGPQGPAGVAGVSGASTTIQKFVVVLAKAPYTSKKTHAVTVRRNGKTVAIGTIRGRTLRVTLAGRATQLSGKYTVKLSAGSKRAVSIKVAG